MYKITLYDNNCNPICDGTICFFTEDIEDFQKRWFRLLDGCDEERKERFLRSKAGEIVTDYYSDSPELNIVQQDEEAVYDEKIVVLEDETFEVYNAYHWSEQYHVNQWTIHFRWICFKGNYYRIASYKANGVCELGLHNRWEDVVCYGNPVLENAVVYRPEYNFRLDESQWPNPGFDRFSENRIETICWLTSAFFESEQELRDDITTFEVTKEIMGRLFADVIGEAG